MSKQPRKTMAVIGWGYDHIMLPMEKAHQLQQILAGDDVFKCGQDWSNRTGRSMYVTSDMIVPSVDAVKKDWVTIDLTMLTDKQRRDYQSEVLAPYRNGDSDVMMGIKEWLALRGEE